MGWPLDQQAAEIVERCGTEAERPFDLTRDLMLRASLLRLSRRRACVAADDASHRVRWLVATSALARIERSVRHRIAVMRTPLLRGACLFNTRIMRSGNGKHWRANDWTPCCGTGDSNWRACGALELPTDRPRLPQSTYRGARYEFYLGQ